MVVKRSLRGKGYGTEAVAVAVADALPDCPLCGRPMVRGPSVDAHHLVPRSEGGRDTETVHRVCHRKIHATLTERELATTYRSWDALRAHPDIAAFIRWLRGKPPEFYDRSVKTNAMRRRR